MGRPLWKVLTLAVALAAASGVFAQDKAATLAEMRDELHALAAQLQSLKSELVSGGQAAMQAAGGASALDRMNTMEAELAQLTAAQEQLQIRVEKVVADGTNRVGDLEFRICELEKGCDSANLPITAKLGGDAPAPAAPAAPAASAGGANVPAATPTAPKVELAMNEQSDFDAAKAKMDKGDFAGAGAALGTFAQNYPGGPLTGEAQFLQGEALSKAGDTENAARAYLASFTGAPEGPHAPASLLRLGAALGLLGQTQDACVTLGQVSARFPNAPEAGEAATTMQKLGCQ
ncbi:MAG: tol-pal system protein YbgF [Rhodobacteraceae bacterium]|nr:tol-pal system protein YbgF [Paracoccaceae bacterium]